MQALLAQSQQPIEQQQVKGRFSVPINPLQGIAKVAQAYVGARGLQDTNKAYGDLSSKYQKGVADAMKGYEQTKTGTPATPFIDEGAQAFDLPQPSGLIEKTAVPGDPRKAIADAMMNPYLQNSPLVSADMKQEEAEKTLRVNKQLTAEEKLVADQRHADLMRELKSTPAPSTTDIVDPDNPKRMLKIDARIYKGGSLGSPGVIGIAGKEPGEVKRQGDVEKGKTELAASLDALSSYYDNLEKQGAVIDPKQSTLKNIWERAATTGVGQSIAGFAGTKAQTERDKINQARASIMAGMKQATGMSAQALNSNAELMFYLQMATDPSKSIRANRAALAHLDRRFNLGLNLPGDPDEEKRLSNTAPVKSASKESGWSIKPIP